MTNFQTFDATPGTQGPADPNASGRVKSYAVLSGLLGLIPVLTVFKVITTDQGAAIGTFTQAALGLAGAFGFAFVAKKTSNQIKDGVFKPAPPTEIVVAPTHSESIVETVKKVQDQFAEFTNSITSGITQVKDVAAFIPGLSGLIEPGGLADDFLKREN